MPPTLDHPELVPPAIGAVCPAPELVDKPACQWDA